MLSKLLTVDTLGRLMLYKAYQVKGMEEIKKRYVANDRQLAGLEDLSTKKYTICLI